MSQQGLDPHTDQLISSLTQSALTMVMTGLSVDLDGQDEVPETQQIKLERMATLNAETEGVSVRVVLSVQLIEQGLPE